MPRLFIAIRPPPSIRQQLLETMGGIAGARWQSDDQLHLTLRFIGDVDRHRADDIAVELARIAAPSMTLALHGVGTFGSGRRVDTLWAGISPVMEIGDLHRKADRACTMAGQPAEDRAYRPHITIARLNLPPEACAAFLAFMPD